jgi:NADPH:quinone reductase-like Zn-dependent oxidoreductase
MQAIRVHQFGGRDALVPEDVLRPVPGDGEVLLRVMAAWPHFAQAVELRQNPS